MKRYEKYLRSKLGPGVALCMKVDEENHIIYLNIKVGFEIFFDCIGSVDITITSWEILEHRLYDKRRLKRFVRKKLWG